MGRFTLKLVHKPRECGDCTLCCHIGEVEELGHKPAYTPCPHQSGNGCGIHGEHPKSCQKFQCGWLTGIGKTRDRPDRIGVYMTATDTGEFGRIIRLHAMSPGALNSDRVINFLGRAQVIDKYIVVGTTQMGDIVLGGPEPIISQYRNSLRKSDAAGEDTGFIHI